MHAHSLSIPHLLSAKVAKSSILPPALAWNPVLQPVAQPYSTLPLPLRHQVKTRNLILGLHPIHQHQNHPTQPTAILLHLTNEKGGVKKDYGWSQIEEIEST